MDQDVHPRRQQHLLRLLALASFGAGCLIYIQLKIPLTGTVWDLLWLLFLGWIEWVTDPFLKKVGFWKRLLWGLGIVAVVLGLTFGVARLAKPLGNERTFLSLFPWFLTGLILLGWSFFIHNDTLPD